VLLLLLLLLLLLPGNGLFTSSSLDKDWQIAHGLLPRSFNQIRIKNYFGVRRLLSTAIPDEYMWLLNTSMRLLCYACDRGIPPDSY
jgi:hypothetical protein